MAIIRPPTPGGSGGTYGTTVKPATTQPATTKPTTPAKNLANLANSAASTINYYLPAQMANNVAQQNTSAAMEFNAAQAEKQMQFQKQSAKEAMEFNAAEAQKNRDWQKMMSDSAYQRAIIDMKKAGLNPILAYQQGGSSTPSGATASGYAMNGASGSSSAAQAFKADATEAITLMSMTAMLALINNMTNIFGSVKEYVTKGEDGKGFFANTIEKVKSWFKK